MSVHVIAWVLHHSKARLGDRLVLLVLADKANDDGTGAWPSVRTIAREARMSVRAVQYSLRRLERAGAIVETGTSGHGTTVYAVLTTPLKFCRGAIHDRDRVGFCTRTVS
jgi:hypothetical protein